MKPDYELTDEEIKNPPTPCRYLTDVDTEGKCSEKSELECAECEKQAVARLARKKLVEWLEGTCTEHFTYKLPRLDCRECMQSLRKELGIKP